MRIKEKEELDFDDVLIRPKRSSLVSRSEVDITRTFKMPHSKHIWTGIPIISANMTGVSSLEMSRVLNSHDALCALHKFHNLDKELFDHLNNIKNSFFTIGCNENEFAKLEEVMAHVSKEQFLLCIDVANGYSEQFISFVEKVRNKYPDIIIMAGNVATAEMTEQLILSGADIVKIGIGPGGVCETRKVSGIGCPQLSSIIECADAAHGLEGLICADGGCKVFGDFAKSFGAGADFVMSGSIFSGHKECIDPKFGINLIKKEKLDWNNFDSFKIIDVNNVPQRIIQPRIIENKYIRFFGMSSKEAMDEHYGGMKDYRCPEGKEVMVPYKGSVENTIKNIYGGLRSACTYVGARKLKELSKRTTFIKVRRQLNDMFR
jgi:GMP reductase